MSATTSVTDINVHRPLFSEAEAAKIAVDLFGIRAAAKALPSERDQNFRLDPITGGNAGDHVQRYVLKIASAAEERAVLEMQNSAMNHIAMANADILSPRVLKSSANEEIATVESDNGIPHFVRLLTYLEGIPLAQSKPHGAGLHHAIGATLGMVDNALANFLHPATPTDFHWDLQNAAQTIRTRIEHVIDPERRAIVDHFLDRFEKFVLPQLPQLRHSTIQNDANDYNLIVQRGPLDASGVPAPVQVGVIDFGDMVYSMTVGELAIGAAYALLDQPDPLVSASNIVRGYHEVYPLTETEIGLLYDLICIRLCTSVVMSAQQQKLEPENDYLSISEKPAWSALFWLHETSPQLAEFHFRHACGLPADPKSERIIDWLQRHQSTFAPILQEPISEHNAVVIDFGISSPLLGSTPILSSTAALTDHLFRYMDQNGATIGIGRYDEARHVYAGEMFATGNGQRGSERRTIHMGIDLFAPAGSAIYAPLDGVVHSFQNNKTHLDYGPCIILEHETEAGDLFFTLYGHLSLDSLDGLSEGMIIEKGKQLACIGDYPINGDWPPHLHFQLNTRMLGRRGEFPGVAAASQRPIWHSISPNPNVILGIPKSLFPPMGRSKQALITGRQQSLGPSLSTSYKKHLQIVRGEGRHLFDETGRAYLDVVNNVCHVGHCHPKVVAAGQAQMGLLNTNTRYLHDNLVAYCERLTATLPEPLSVCFLVCSGSEANELALRMARAATGNYDVITVDSGYHGNTQATIDISPYKFNGKGGQGAPEFVHMALMPDLYRGKFTGADAGARYAAHIPELINDAARNDQGIAAYICESILSCGGQLVLPDGYLAAAYEYVRAAGGLCIADEVQVGFGRVGTHFWAFEAQGVVPDIVTMGKPIGNGHPLAAVVTTPEIAQAFANGMEYFNTFGGNPVSCAIGLAVLDVIEEEGLQENARDVGEYLLAELKKLKPRHPLIGDVRGLGLFVGIEFVLDHDTLEPAAAQAAYIVERAKDLGLLLSTDGPLYNVIKMKPPLVFDRADVDFLVQTLDHVLQDDLLQG